MGPLLYRRHSGLRWKPLDNGGRSDVVVHPSQLRTLVVNKLSSNRPVLLIGRDPPQLIVRKLGVNDSRLRLLWLSTVEHPNAVSPRDLYKLEFYVTKDVSTRKSDVILDGIEYLILESGLVPTLKFLAKVNDITFLNGSRLHLVLGDALNDREVALLRRTLGVF